MINYGKTHEGKLLPHQAAIGDKGKVVKINVDKNNELAQALRIKGLPTLMIYKSGEMMWRQSGEQDADTLINLINEFI